MARRRPPLRVWLAAGALLLLMSSTAGAQVMIDPENPTFAIVTHKAGFASGMAHNHLIAAPEARVRFTFDPETPLATRFELETAAAELDVDNAERQTRVYPRLEALGVLDEPFGELSDKDRAKIRKSMLGKDQLGGQGCEPITARIAGIEKSPSTHGQVELPYAVQLALTVCGKTVEKKVAARYQLTDGVLEVEAVGVFRFTDFGIEPYSAFLGAVKNEDAFHVYVSLRGSTATR